MYVGTRYCFGAGVWSRYVCTYVRMYAHTMSYAPMYGRRCREYKQDVRRHEDR